MIINQQNMIIDSKLLGSQWNCFRSTSRDKFPSWALRTVKDSNDLVYDADPYSISNKLKRSITSKKNKVKEKEINPQLKKYEYSPVKSREKYRARIITRKQDNHNLAGETVKKQFGQTATSSKFEPDSPLRKFIKASNMTDKKDIIIDNMNSNMAELRQGASLNMYGLSKFQFQQTLLGKIISKSNHHIDFDKKPNKIYEVSNQEEPTDRNQDESESELLKKKLIGLSHIHSFRHYDSHHLFNRPKSVMDSNGCGNGGLLDKFYETVNIFTVTKRTTFENVDFRIMTARPDIQRQSLDKDYRVEKLNTLSNLNDKTGVMRLSRSERRLVFGKEIEKGSRGSWR